MSKYLHECAEWDGMEIDENHIEFACCLCFGDDEEAKKIRDELNEELVSDKWLQVGLIDFNGVNNGKY